MVQNLKNNIKKAFSISEVIVATFISVIILSFIFVFISNIISWISTINQEVKILSSFYDFTNKVNNYRNVYISWSILVDNIGSSDVFLMKDVTWENGILIWPVSLINRKLDLWTIYYKNKWVWFRKVSTSEIANIETDVNVIYNYEFHSDQIFWELKAKEMSFVSYNWWKIYDLFLYVDVDYQSSMVGLRRDSIPKDKLRRFNINF